MLVAFFLYICARNTKKTIIMQNLDALDEQILSMIADNARIPFLEVARVCHVSGAAIHQHIQKLTQMGVIKGSQFVFDPEALGYGTCAFVGLFLKDPSDFDRVVAELRCIPEVVECHYTTGNYDIFIKIYAHNNHHLLSIIHDKLQPLGIQRSETIISFNEAFNRQFPVPNTAERLSGADGEPCTAEELSGEGLVTDATQALRGENRLPNTTPSSNAKSMEPGAKAPTSSSKSREQGAKAPSSANFRNPISTAKPAGEDSL